MDARKMLAKFVDKSAINFKINDRKKICELGELKKIHWCAWITRVNKCRLINALKNLEYDAKINKIKKTHN